MWTGVKKHHYRSWWDILFQVVAAKWRREGLLAPMLAIVVSQMVSTFAFFKDPSCDVACGVFETILLLLKRNL